MLLDDRADARRVAIATHEHAPVRQLVHRADREPTTPVEEAPLVVRELGEVLRAVAVDARVQHEVVAARDDHQRVELQVLARERRRRGYPASPRSGARATGPACRGRTAGPRACEICRGPVIPGNLSGLAPYKGVRAEQLSTVSVSTAGATVVSHSGAPATWSRSTDASVSGSLARQTGAVDGEHDLVADRDLDHLDPRREMVVRRQRGADDRALDWRAAPDRR